MDRYENKWECKVYCKYPVCKGCIAKNDCEFCAHEDSEACIYCEKYYEKELSEDESESGAD